MLYSINKINHNYQNFPAIKRDKQQQCSPVGQQFSRCEPAWEHFIWSHPGDLVLTNESAHRVGKHTSYITKKIVLVLMSHYLNNLSITLAILMHFSNSGIHNHYRELDSRMFHNFILALFQKQSHQLFTWKINCRRRDNYDLPALPQKSVSYRTYTRYSIYKNQVKWPIPYVSFCSSVV